MGVIVFLSFFNKQIVFICKKSTRGPPPTLQGIEGPR